MSEGPPDIVVDFSPAWAQVSWGDDIEAWAPAAADRLWAASGGPRSDLDVRRLAAELEVMARSAFVVPCFGAFVFCPELARGPRAVLRLTGLRYEPGTGEREIIEEVVLPDDQQLIAPEVEHLNGPVLRRIRIRQRAWTDKERVIADYIAYVFPFDEGAWLLSTSLPDPREAERWLADLDQLSAGVQLRETA
jgi:hypothetical protein